MARLETSADSPVPVRVVALRLGEWIARLGEIWVEGQIAQLTRGKFIFIEYGSTQETAAKHGVTGPVDGGNNLDEILLKQLTEEIDRWGK